MTAGANLCRVCLREWWPQTVGANLRRVFLREGWPRIVGAGTRSGASWRFLVTYWFHVCGLLEASWAHWLRGPYEVA